METLRKHISNYVAVKILFLIRNLEQMIEHMVCEYAILSINVKL
jgi:hypothetical protein